MKKIITTTQTWCDHPACLSQGFEDPQETQTVELTFRVISRGRRPSPIVVEMCATHVAEMKEFMTHLSRYSQKDLVGE